MFSIQREAEDGSGHPTPRAVHPATRAGAAAPRLEPAPRVVVAHPTIHEAWHVRIRATGTALPSPRRALFCRLKTSHSTHTQCCRPRCSEETAHSPAPYTRCAVPAVTPGCEMRYP